MSERVQLRRGLASAIASAIGAAGELFFGTDTKRLYVQDGSTAGGFALALYSDVSGWPSSVTNTPPGAVMIWPGATATAGDGSLIPSGVTGWSICNGQALSRTSYPNLNALASAASYAWPWGPGDGSTTFNVLNLQSIGIIGAASGSAGLPSGFTGGLTSRSFGAKVGQEAVTLTSAQIPAHLHPITDKQHTHTQNPHSHSDLQVFAPSQTAASGGYSAITGGATSSVTATNQNAFTGITSTDNSTGGGGSHLNMPPVVAFHFMIKV